MKKETAERISKSCGYASAGLIFLMLFTTVWLYVPALLLGIAQLYFGLKWCDITEQEAKRRANAEDEARKAEFLRKLRA